MQPSVFGLCPAPGAAGRGSAGAVAREGSVMGICAGAGEDFQPGALSWRKRQLCRLERESRRGRMDTSSCIQDLGFWRSLAGL